MKRDTKILLLLFVITLLGSILRFYQISSNPPSLNIDEVSYGYSAYSILKTGHDENGIFMPLVFKSIGDYKNPLLTYSIVPSIAFFGLNEFGVRFSTALIGSLSIPLFFLLTQSLFKDKRVALLSAGIMAISPWHIYYSRVASESLVATFFLMLGVYLFQKMLFNGRIWAFICACAFILSMYTYHSHKLVTPLLIIVLILVNLQRLKQAKSNLSLFILVSFVLTLPLAILTIFGSANTRASMIFLTQDIDYTRYVVLDHIYRGGESLLFIFFWAKRYLNYFQPDFLFFNGLNMTTGIFGLGVFYLFELPWMLLGVIRLIRQHIPNKSVIVLWIVLGFIPASLTNNEQSSLRSLLVLPAFLMIISLGALSFFDLILKIKKSYLKLGVISIYTFFVVIVLLQAFLIFSVHFPLQRSEAFMEGTKESVLYAIEHKDLYKEIVYDPYRGIEGPYIVNIPYMYILFYSQYDPIKFQQEFKQFSTNGAHFDKFTIRPIDWRVDRSQKGVLFIGSPWSLPQKDIKDEEILRKIYLQNGSLALIIVSPLDDDAMLQND